MKKLFALIFVLCLYLGAFAQQLNYQAIIRDNNQQLVTNTNVTANIVVKVSGNPVYQQTVNGTTNLHGLFDIPFGDVTFSSIDWSHATISVQVKNTATGVIYMPAEDRPVNAVPYALNATSATQVNADWEATNGAAQILNKPTLFSGDYNDLENKPTLFDGDYNNLSNKPTIPTNVGDLTNNANYVDNTDCSTISFCDLYALVAELQDSLASMRSTISVLNNKIEELSPSSPTASLPTVTTSAISNISGTTATGGGNVTSDGGATITARGICWSTSQNPTISNSHTTNGGGAGSFTSSITGLAGETTYYVRAYATNSEGTAYGEQISFTTTFAYQTWNGTGLNPNDAHPCQGAPTVTDIDNNTYNTVQIGTQCWMKENLRTTKYPNGTLIPFETANGSRWYPSGNGANVSKYGYLYTWEAVMNGAASSSASPSGVQGICPAGWHVPSSNEWKILSDYVSSQSVYTCNDNSLNIAKSLASTSGWASSGTACAVGNTPANNNLTGFSAVPAGDHYTSYTDFSTTAIFWSSTESINNKRISYDGKTFGNGSGARGYAYSVRCVHN